MSVTFFCQISKRNKAIFILPKKIQRYDRMLREAQGIGVHPEKFHGIFEYKKMIKNQEDDEVGQGNCERITTGEAVPRSAPPRDASTIGLESTEEDGGTGSSSSLTGRRPPFLWQHFKP